MDGCGISDRMMVFLGWAVAAWRCITLHFWAVVCAMIFFQLVVNFVAWGSWGAVAVLVVVLLGFWCS